MWKSLNSLDVPLTKATELKPLLKNKKTTKLFCPKDIKID